jgi:RNA polymerase sigma-70 factor, ECF subfamily
MLPESDLIARAQTVPSALEELVIAIRPHIERQLLRYPVSDEDRRDLLQSTLLQVVRRLASFRGESSFSTWLFRVTANEAFMLMRSQRRHRARLVEGLDLEDLGCLYTSKQSVEEERHESSSRLESEAVVRNALAELPQDYRDLVLAHYHEDLCLQEIADKMSMTESAVRSRLHRARSRLRTILETMAVGARPAEAEAAA